MTATGARWRNWARTEQVTPVRVERPTSPAAVQRAVAAANSSGLRIKAVGAGHSFTGIAVAPGVLLELDDLSGLVAVDRDRGRATLLAGTRLYSIPALLKPYGLAMANLGDIDRQSISGAISTGTHGTGSGYTGIAAQVVGVTMVTGSGELLSINEDHNPELLNAAALGLGALGILVDVTVQCVPAFLLHAQEHSFPLASLFDTEADDPRSLTSRVDNSDHFEFYWFPHTDSAVAKTNTRLAVDSERKPLPAVTGWIDDVLLANGFYRATCALGTVVPAVIPSVNRVAEKLMGNREFTDHSHRVFATRRTVRFREMEYAIPAADVPEVLAELRALITQHGWKISFPVEVRFAAADSLWLSTAAERASGYIAVHRYYREDPTEYFDAVEQIMVAHGGRPHWGKLHTRDSEYLRRVYPHFDDFIAVRDRLDPNRTFSNPYLTRVLGA